MSQDPGILLIPKKFLMYPSVMLLSVVYFTLSGRPLPQTKINVCAAFLVNFAVLQHVIPNKDFKVISSDVDFSVTIALCWLYRYIF